MVSADPRNPGLASTPWALAEATTGSPKKDSAPQAERPAEAQELSVLCHTSIVSQKLPAYQKAEGRAPVSKPERGPLPFGYGSKLNH